MPLPEGPVPTSAPEAAVIEVSGTALTQAADDHWDDDDHEGDDDHGDDDDHHDDDSRSHEDEHDD
jgi:hypothetical protein